MHLLKHFLTAFIDCSCAWKEVAAYQPTEEPALNIATYDHN